MSPTLLLATVLAMGPFEKNAPHVDEGIEAFEANKFDEALTHFEAAAKERPNDARVQFNLGATLSKLGRNPEAKLALGRAEELDSKHEFTNQIHYNRGTVAAIEGQKEEAVKEYRKALRANPNDEQSRHNLEVMLRDLPPKKKNQPDGGTGDAGSNDGGPSDGGGGRDGGSDAGRPDGGSDGGSDGGGDSGTPGDGGLGDAGPPGDAGQGDGGSGDGGNGDQEQPGDGGDSQKGDRGDGGSDGGRASDGGLDDQQGGQPDVQPDGGMSKNDAEKALDSMKNGEKNLQLWRFRQKTQKNDNHGKDW